MLKHVVEPEKIEAYLAVQIAKVVSQVNISADLNIQAYQIPLIAEQLVSLYPVETVEDFTLCFKRGAAGFYGRIYRLDAATISEWMKQYLDEKYSHVELGFERTRNENEESVVNYEAFRERVSEFLQQDKKGFSSADENEIQRQKLANPYKYFAVRGVQIYAKSQEHAEQIAKRLIDSGELEEY